MLQVKIGSLDFNHRNRRLVRDMNWKSQPLVKG